MNSKAISFPHPLRLRWFLSVPEHKDFLVFLSTALKAWAQQ
jgi:hypothetical protein